MVFTMHRVSCTTGAFVSSSVLVVALSHIGLLYLRHLQALDPKVMHLFSPLSASLTLPYHEIVRRNEYRNPIRMTLSTSDSASIYCIDYIQIRST